MIAVDFFSRPNHSTSLVQRSPLGARDLNTCNCSGVLPSRMSTCNNDQKRRLREPRKRESKYAPLLRTKDDRASRRSTYLNTSQRSREDQRFEARAEQNLRLQWIEEKRQWEAQKAAEQAAQLEEEEEEDFPPHSEEDVKMQESDMPDPPGDDEDVFQYYLLSQEQESSDPQLPELNQHAYQGMHRTTSQDFWSDDDDFERSLMDAAMKVERGPDPATAVARPQEQDDMDLTM